ncbi:mechanosensitive ion channel family protein [Radiobacillus kanasensis]|uniref:mechanosensitive ion channel family protein n=1 Tax=Radiobacillus kanasensis TaxID=2844358 RepID=UPI001E64DE97|nr:mechanosensitive ion channel family protein [Radiobacillus kanasensis]UFU00017.1 mechanosensitive ion channel family protein [Radiobacillus kanasensis]
MNFFDSPFFKHPVTQIAIGVIFTVILVLVLRRIIHSLFKRTDFISEKKEKTIESMVNSIVQYAATFGLIVYVLYVFDIEVGKILAGAGVLGLIIGFGAQNLVKDWLAGIFLLYEKQLQQGDWIKVNNLYSGIVEDVGLRSIKIRQWSGELLILSNGQIQTVQNYNFDKMRVIEQVTVSFYEDPRRIFSVLEDACERLNQELHEFLKKDLTGKPVEPFQIYGMTALNDQYRGYQYAVIGLCDDLVYWTAAKETRRILAETMYDHKIQMAEQHIEYRPKEQRET